MRPEAGEAPTVAQPRVSVVVSTFDRSERLERLVTSLRHQRLDQPHEFVIVDNGSTDETASVLEALTDDDERFVIRRIDENRGPARARNLGWRTARSALVAFTDDDCRAHPDWLAELLRAAQAVDIVQGRTEPDPDHAHRWGPFSRTQSVGHETGHYQTCNIAYRRSWLEALGGFDEHYVTAAGEDTDLAWRAINGGAVTTFAEDAVVYHEISESSYGQHLRGTQRWIGLALLVKQHPELRRQFHRRVFWKPSHPPALIAAGGFVAALVLPRRSGLPAFVLGLVPYLRLRRRWAPLSDHGIGQMWLVPMSIVADLAEVGALARGSVRYRSLLL